eukprot:TRINITY_DN3374_c0_g1_i1.p1 TRINITY_DN3374_c0_g1~~TRINITY_DN3374_c0_g1_i1.p1  ORF type:complete len:260 (+),score=31.67 TRINITY_DN3374_c0_g1_i1:74-853(+)
MRRAGSLGVLDWGIGGLDFVNKFKRLHPTRNVAYIGDQGATPYGKQGREELAERVHTLIRFLQSSHDCTHVVVACNAASTVLDHPLFAGIPVTGVIKPTSEAILAKKGLQEVSVIGGRATIESNSYKNALPGVNVRQVVAQPLSALIEEGAFGTDRMDKCLVDIFSQLEGTQNLIMGCTHYTALSLDTVKHYLPTVSTLIDPAQETLQWAERQGWFDGEAPVAGSTAGDVFLSTGDTEAMERAACLAWGMEISVHSVAL